jgi:hypothetical protein
MFPTTCGFSLLTTSSSLSVTRLKVSRDRTTGTNPFARKVWPRTGTASDWRWLRAVLQATAARRLCARRLQCRAGDEKSGLDARARALCRPADAGGATRCARRQAARPARHWKPSTSTRRSIGDRTSFTFALFTWEFVQHEAIHHGQWSIYASLAGFETPLSWRASWGL